MSRGARLERLEAALPDPARAGRRCPGCGGLHWADFVNARAVLAGTDRGEARPPAWARGVLFALEAGSATCELCGAGTLHGARAELDAVPDDADD